jgi:hypothetical protein
MSDPINYGINPVNPLQNFANTFSVFNQVRQSQLQADAQRQAAEAARQKQLAEEERKKRIAELTIKVSSPTASAQDWNEYSQLVSPESMKAAASALTSRDEAKNNAYLIGFGESFSALNAGKPEIAIGGLKSHAEALRNSGDEMAADRFDLLASVAETDPVSAKLMIGQMIPLFKGGSDLIKSTIEQQAAPSDVENVKADTELKKAQARKLLDDLESSKTPGSAPLDTDAKKIINTAVDSIISSDLLASQATNLADAFDRERPAGGWVGNAFEALKKAAGGQDKFTSLKQEYIKLRNTDVLKNLPPGVASDKDIEIALKAFPDEGANPDQISSFLRGVAKLQGYNSAVNKAKSEWVNSNGSLGPARSVFSAGGVEVKKGQNFWDAIKQIPVPNVAGGVSSSGQPKSGTTGTVKPKVVEGDF